MYSFLFSRDDSSRFSTITSSNHAGYIWIVTILAIIYTVLSSILRAYVKWRMYGWDDLILVLATLVYLAQAVSVFNGLANKLAQIDDSIESNETHEAGKAFFASEVLAITSLCLSKCSVLAMMLRLWTRTADFKRWIASLGLLFLSLLWGVGSVLGVVVNCVPSTMLRPDNLQHCPNQYSRWQAITSVDIITDIIICLLPPILTWSLAMSITWKTQVTLAFGFRIFVIPASIMHLAYFKTYPTSNEPQFAVTRCLILQQIMLASSLISATIPNLKAFMKSFYWGLGFADLERGTVGTSSNVYELQTIGRRSTRQQASKQESKRAAIDPSQDAGGLSRRDPITFRPDAVRHHVSIPHSFSDDRSLARNDEPDLDKCGSREMIIKKEIR